MSREDEAELAQSMKHEKSKSRRASRVSADIAHLLQHSAVGFNEEMFSLKKLTQSAKIEPIAETPTDVDDGDSDGDGEGHDADFEDVQSDAHSQ